MKIPARRRANHGGMAAILGLAALASVLLLTACAPVEAEPAGETAVAISAVPATPPVTTLLPATAIVASPAPTVTAAPSPTSIATAVPLIRLAVPPSWREAATAALAELGAAQGGYAWQLVDEHDRHASLRLLKDGEGLVVQRAPLALAVPLTTPWEAVTGAEAEIILAEGHELATVVPWTEMQPQLKALRVDNRHPAVPDYPLQETWSLHSAPGYAEAAQSLAQHLAEQAADPVVHLVAVGDIMLDRSLGYALANGDLAYPFEDVAAIIRAADVAIGNMESALGDVGTPAFKSYPFRAPPEAAPALAEAGFDVVSLANNHGMDYGPEALLQALDLLRHAGVATIGAGSNAHQARAPFISTVNGLRLAFLGYVDVPVEARSGFDTASWTATATEPGLSWADPGVMASDIEAVRPQADLVIVILHSGYEYVEAPSEPQMRAARAAIDAGADVVIGHHAHILQGIEFYKEKPILYGTGNFAFEIDGAPETALFHLWLDGDGVRTIEIQPAIVQFGGQPRPATPWEAPAILTQVYYLTNALNSQ